MQLSSYILLYYFNKFEKQKFYDWKIICKNKLSLCSSETQNIPIVLLLLSESEKKNFTQYIKLIISHD